MRTSWALLRGGTIGFGGRLALIVLQFGSHYLLAQSLGSRGYGLLSLAISIVFLVAFVARAGIPRALQKFAPIYSISKDYGSLSGLYHWSFRWVVTIAAIATALLFSSAITIERHIFLHEGLSAVIVVVSVSIVVANWVYWLGALGLSLGRVSLEVYGQYIFQPFAYFTFIVIGTVILGSELNVIFAAIAFSSSWICAAVALRSKSKSLKSDIIRVPPSQKHANEWISYSFRVSLPDIVNRAREWLDVIIAGVLLSTSGVGVLALCLRLAYLPALILASFASIFSHKVSQRFSKGDITGLGNEYADVTFSALSISLPLAVLLLILSEEILTIFGASFIEGSRTLKVMIFGQVIASLAGPAWYIMILTGSERQMLVFSLISIFVGVALCVILIPTIGIVGAGLANATSISILSVLQIGHIRRRLGIMPFRIWYARLLPPIVIAFCAVSFFRQFHIASGVIFNALATAAAFGAIYVAVGLPFGIWKRGLIGDVLRQWTKENS